MGSQASKASGDEAMPDDMKANGSSQRSRRPSKRELPPDGDESSEFMSADEDEDEGGVGILGVNGAIGGTEDEIEMSSDSGDEEQEEDVGGVDGADETPLQRTTADTNTVLDAEDAWWAGLSARTDETVARIMRGYGSQPGSSQEVTREEVEEGTDGRERGQEEDNTLVVAQPDEDGTQVVQDSMVLDTVQPPAMISTADQDSGHGSMAESEVGILNVDMETDDQEVHTAPETPNDWQPMNESQQDRMDAAEETVRRIQAERNGNAANGAEHVEEHDVMEIEGYNAGTDISSVTPAAVEPSAFQDQDEQTQQEELLTHVPPKMEKKEMKKARRKQQRMLQLAVQKSNYGNHEDPTCSTVGAASLGKKPSGAEEDKDHAEKGGLSAESNQAFKEEGIDDREMNGGGTRVDTEHAKNGDGVQVEKEKQFQCDRGTRNAEKRRVRREKRRAEREAAGRPKFRGHIEGKPKAEKKIKKKCTMTEWRKADPNTEEGIKAAFIAERKRKKKERRRAEVKARAGGERIDGDGAGGEGSTVEV